MKLTDQITDLTKRVGALESDGFDENATVARVTKIYGNLRVSFTIRAYAHEYRKCGDTNPLFGATCGSDTFL